MGIIDTRKLFLFSRYSLALLLPKTWLNELGIERGELVTLKLDRKRSRIIIKFNSIPNPPVLTETVDHPSQDDLFPIPQLEN